MPITIYHIMTVLLYTNFDELQRAFKQKGCQRLFWGEPDDKVKVRNQEIGNWFKGITECVKFFGSSTTKGKHFTMDWVQNYYFMEFYRFKLMIKLQKNSQFLCYQLGLMVK